MNWATICEIVLTQVVLYVALYRVIYARPTKAVVFCPFLTAALLFLLERFNYPQIPFFVCCVVLYFVLPLLVVRGAGRTMTLFGVLAGVGIFSLAEILFGFLFSAASGNSPDRLNVLSPVVTAAVLLTLFLSNLSMGMRNIISISKNVLTVFTLFVWELFLLITALSSLTALAINNATVAIFAVIMVSLVMLSFVTLYLLLNNNLKKTYYQNRNKEMEQDVLKQVRYYQKIESRNEDIRRFRHDFNNLAIGLRTVLKNKDCDGALSYLDSFENYSKSSDAIFQTGSPFVDALLSDKTEAANERGISVLFEGKIPDGLIAPADLCVMFGNAVDNAIEASVQLSADTERKIKITARQKGDYLFVCITNPTADDICIKNNHIETTKANVAAHGMGLYAINETVRKYDGHLSLQCENRVFTLELDCHLPEATANSIA